MNNELMTHDYLYAMSSMLKSLLYETAPEFSEELYKGLHKDKMKLLTFSPLSSVPRPKSVTIEGEQRSQMLLGKRVYFRIASPWPELLNSLGQALVSSFEIRILNKKFKVTAVNMVLLPQPRETMVWRPFGQAGSIVTAWTERGAKFKQFVYPDSHFDNVPSCETLIKDNLIHTLKRLAEIREDIKVAWLKSAEVDSINPEDIKVEFIDYKEGQAYKRVCHKGKSMPIRSWRCPVKITAPIPVQKLIWACGLGEQNAQGYGLMQEGKNDC